MRFRALPFVIVTTVLVASAALQADATQNMQKRRATKGSTHAAKKAPPPLPCGDLVSFAVLLDRQGFSPGQIDGTANRNFTRALDALRADKKIVAIGQPDCETWKALGGDGGEPPIMNYTVTDADVQGPFEPQIPKELPEQAQLEALAYRTPLEELAERFHASPALIQKLNPGGTIAAGQSIKVPGVLPFDASVRPPANDTKPNDISIDVSRNESALRAIRSDGTIVLYAPVTTGSQHDPLPLGDWKVTGLRWNPPFHYSPSLFWDARPSDTKATLKPGPNNPVGVVWIDLNLDHYGLHGTPEPGSVGMSQSHGCVRLTNWDAARVAALVKPGTAVKFH
jgi:lipoprotein-anchoring transpeptidase ErfK/SrfK